MMYKAIYEVIQALDRTPENKKCLCIDFCFRYIKKKHKTRDSNDFTMRRTKYIYRRAGKEFVYESHEYGDYVFIKQTDPLMKNGKLPQGVHVIVLPKKIAKRIFKEV